MSDEGYHSEALMTETVQTDILWHYHFLDFEQNYETESLFQHKKHESEKITLSGFSLNITKLFVNNHRQT